MPPDLKAEVWAELKAGRGIVEAYLANATHHLDGLCEGKRVVINPACSVVEISAHELIHRIRPRWGETRVATEARRMLAGMSDREVRAWYRAYQRAARHGRTVKVED